MRKLFVLLAAVLISSFAANAQDYEWAAGIRAGVRSTSLVLKKSISPFNAYEGAFASYYERGDHAKAFHFTGYYDFQMPIIDEGFSFYYGPGVHIGFGSDYFGLGLDGIVGLEYKIPEVPIIMSVDYRPSLNIVEKFDFYGDFDLGFGVKFTW